MKVSKINQSNFSIKI